MEDCKTPKGTHCYVCSDGLPFLGMMCSACRLPSFYYYRACLYSMLLLINNSRQCLLISHCVPGTVLSAFLKYTHLTLLMTQSNRYL